MTLISQRITNIESRIQLAEASAQRSQGCVRLLAVGKKHSAGALIQAYHAGLRHFGESYLQEAIEKQQQLSCFDITWHFIGPIQSNKTRAIANLFHWVHSVDRLKIAKRLSNQRSETLPPLDICLQVNVSGEESKSGVALQDLPELVEQVSTLPRLRLRGLMAIPAKAESFDLQRQPFRLLQQAFGELNKKGVRLDTLSMGMTDDMEAAIAEGATIVRVGTALFGIRE